MQPIVSDFRELTGAFLLFPLVIVIPGYVLAHLSGLFSDEDKPMHWSIGLLVSIALCPVMLYYLMRFIGPPAAWIFLGSCWLAFLYLQYQQRDTLRQRVSKSLRPG